MNTSYLISFIILLQLFGIHRCIAYDDSITVKRIEYYLDTLEKIGFSGSVLVEVNGKKVISKGYGYSDQKQEIKNTPATIFDIGSITKQFTAAAIMKLEMQGKLSTGNKISQYFNNVPADKTSITIHDLLRHQSGLPSNVGNDFEAITEKAFIDSVMKAPLKFAPGERFSYSNIGYSLLAIIIENVSELSYEDYLYANLWKPAGMDFTGYSQPAFRSNLIATGYDNDDNAWGKPTEKSWDKNAPYWHLKGNGGILSTTEDLYKWHKVLLSDSILSRAAKEKYYHPQFRQGEMDNPYYAYGWDITKTGRNTLLTRHNGTNRIFYADFWRYIDEGTAIIMMSNKGHNNFVEINNEISQIIFNPHYIPEIPIADNKENRTFTDDLINTTIKNGFSAGQKEFENRKSGINLLENKVNEKGYDLINEKKKGQAIDVFRLNVLAFPESANAYDSLGEAYMENGNKDLAIENYKKSLLLDPENSNAKKMISKLELQ